ncbi:hypothetical protein [Pseudonocardia phyllosphaerae]|uniref:hypothetical protein n=1 Tax=Pseudonocardia phyllosphaerae TaxID=3390502 RepID=UPI00397DBF2B
MARDDPPYSPEQGPGADRRPGPGDAPPGDAVLAALARRLRARSERQQLLTERLRSGELRPGALADLAELAAAARRGARDGDHLLVLSGAGPDRRPGPPHATSLGQVLTTVVAASEAASRTVVLPTPSVTLETRAEPVVEQILAELLAHAGGVTPPGERIELHTRWSPDGGVVVELQCAQPPRHQTPLDDLDRALSTAQPNGPVAPQEIGLHVAARLARSIGATLGVRGPAGSTEGAAVAVLHLPPAVVGGGQQRAEPRPETPAGARPVVEDGDTGDSPWPPPRPSARSFESPAAQPGPRPGGDLPRRTPGPNRRQQPFGAPADAASFTAAPFGAPGDSSPSPFDTGPAAYDAGPPGDSGTFESGQPLDSGRRFDSGTSPFDSGASGSGSAPFDSPAQFDGPAQENPPRPGWSASAAAPFDGPPPGQANRPFPSPAQRPPSRPPQPAPSAESSPGAPETEAEREPGTRGTEAPGDPLTEALPVSSGPDRDTDRDTGSRDAPPAHDQQIPGRQNPEQHSPDALFGPFDSEVPVPVGDDDLESTPIFASVASAWFREPSSVPTTALPVGADGTPEPENWRTAGDAEFDAARIRADRVVDLPTTAQGLPQRQPGRQMVPPSWRDTPNGSVPQGSRERQPDRVRTRLSSYQRGLREGRHRAADDDGGQTDPMTMNGTPGTGARHGADDQPDRDAG